MLKELRERVVLIVEREMLEGRLVSINEIIDAENPLAKTKEYLNLAKKRNPEVPVYLRKSKTLEAHLANYIRIIMVEQLTELGRIANISVDFSDEDKKYIADRSDVVVRTLLKIHPNLNKVDYFNKAKSNVLNNKEIPKCFAAKNPGLEFTKKSKETLENYRSARPSNRFLKELKKEVGNHLELANNKDDYLITFNEVLQRHIEALILTGPFGNHLNEQDITQLAKEISKELIKKYPPKGENMENKKQQVAAFFDIDGTIFRGSLLISHFKTLRKYGMVASVDCVEVDKLEKQWLDREINYEEYLTELVEVYRKAITGISKEDMKFTAKMTVQKEGNQLYNYTRDRLKWHNDQGHKVVLISGSPDYLVNPLSVFFDVPCIAIGTRYLTDKKGQYTGETLPMWDSASKEKTIESLEASLCIDLKNSYAYGDTTGDLAMFKKVGNPVAINPNLRLINAIKKDNMKVKVILERKDVAWEVDIDQVTFP